MKNGNREFVQATCPLCRAPSALFVKTVRDSRHFIAGQWRLLQCPSCGLAFLGDPPPPEQMRGYYPPNIYYTHSPQPRQGRLITLIYDYHYGVRRSAWRGLVYRVMSRFVDLFPPVDPDGPCRLLDYGCGNGHLMKRFSTYGFSCEGFDVDPAAQAQSASLGFTVYDGNERTIPSGRTYGVVILNHVLEHLVEPRSALRRIADHCKPSTVLLVTVPNAACVDFRILRDSWTSFQAPTHVRHYNARSLKMLLRESGFDVVSLRYASSLVTLRPAYVLRNLRALWKLEGVTVAAVVRSALFCISALMVFLPWLSGRKRPRMTAYCRIRGGS